MTIENAVLVGGPHDGQHRYIESVTYTFVTTTIVPASMLSTDPRAIDHKLVYDRTDEFDTGGYRRYVLRRSDLEMA